MPFLLLFSLLILLIPIYLFFLFIRRNRISNTFAFFHPYCDACGGGERVLWLALNALYLRFPELNFIIYTGDINTTSEQIIKKANSRFNISIPTDRLNFIFLKTRWILESKNYPRFTLIAQLFSGLIIGFEALFKFNPEWFIDTTGCPLTLPLFYWIGGAKTICYIHYPIITKEMIQLINCRITTYNNSSIISSSFLLTKLKLFYYRIISFLYKLCGKCSQLTIVNGSWTSSHIENLWLYKPFIIYPPCNVEKLLKLKNKSEEENKTKIVKIISVGQIRPEKDHLKQLRIFAEVKQLIEKRKLNINIKLIIAGGCRNEEDLKRVEFLQNYARGNFGMEPGVEIDWELNINWERLEELMENSLIGLHTMWNEHFGISVVEGMAAGIIMVAHNSGGPLLDIIGNNNNLNEINNNNKCGFLANTNEEYINTIINILEMTSNELENIRNNARNKALNFSDNLFEKKFCDLIASFFEKNKEI
ncbi:hypothetical protein Mgra_00004030, partial [Meloidogyne graminicola]